MNRNCLRSYCLAIATLLATACYGQQDETPPVDMSEAGILEPTPTAILRIDDSDGGHLEEGHLLAFIGPVGEPGFYILVPLPSTPAHHWRPDPVIATPNDLGDYFIQPVVDMSPDHSDPTEHTMVMRIESEDPLRIRIVAPEHTGTTGSHGGSAHGSLD